MSSRSRFRLVALLAAAVLVALTAGGIATAARFTQNRAHAPKRLTFHGKRSRLTAAQIKRLSAAANKRTIIIFKNQLGRVPATRSNVRARESAALAAQSGVRAELTQLHASHIHSYSLINAMSATVSAAEVTRLQANPAVRAVVPDVMRHFQTLDSGPGPALPALAGANAGSGSTQQICPQDPSKPLIEPEAREVMNVAQAEQLADGSGVKVGILADGIDPNNPDLIRADGDHVIFDYQDFSGYGTNAPTDGREAFLDAGTIASQANETYDLSGFVNPAHPLPPGCNIKIAGIAPGASLAVANLQGSGPGFFNSTILAGLQWLVEHDHVNILNESIGGNPLPNTENDPVALADQAAVAAGVTVVASSGDSGPFNNIGSPATTPGVIDVGATTTYRVYRQTTRYGTQLSPGGWEDNNISGLSSDGFTQVNPSTVNVVAPGDRGWSLCSSDTTHFTGCADLDHGANPPPIWAAGGTSASAPETSGTAALVINAYEKTHGGTAPSPELVQRIIVSSAQDLHAPANRQGAGLVNTLKAVQLAETINDGSQPQGNSLLVSRPSLSATVTAGETAQFNVHVTNGGTSPQTVTPTIVGLPQITREDSGSVTLDSTSPTFIDGEGNTDSYQLHRFYVSPGQDYLTGNITWNAGGTQAQPAGTAVFETLFDPQGNVAAYSLLGSTHSGFGHVEVRAPRSGVWTAAIFTVNNAAAFTGPVQFGYFTYRYTKLGQVSPAAQTLAPGQSGTFQVSVIPRQPGDDAYRLHLGTGSPTDGSIPIVVRSLVPVGRFGGSFHGVLNGGADTGQSGQTFTYQFQVPSGQPELNVGLRLADLNADYELHGSLLDPHGEPLDVQDSAQFDASGGFTGFGPVQFFHQNPAAGLWTLTFTVVGPVDGTRLAEGFAGTVGYAPPGVSSHGVPDSPHTRLPSGQPVTATVRVTNTGNSPKDYMVDPRLDGRQQQVLLASDANNVPLPLSFSQQPNWIVPPGTDSFQTLAQSSVPIIMDTSYAFGDPDFGGPSFGTSAVNQLSAPEVAPGEFFALPEATGPDGTTGVPAGTTVNLAGVANTFPFDTTVSSDTGDFWLLAVQQQTAFSPLHLVPGQSGTITVTFTPSGQSGHVVRGFLGVDTLDGVTLSGDEVTTIPYAYRIK